MQKKAKIFTQPDPPCLYYDIADPVLDFLEVVNPITPRKKAPVELQFPCTILRACGS